MAFWIPLAIMVGATVASNELNNAAARKLAGQRDRDIAEGIRQAGENERKQTENLLKTLDNVDPTAQEGLQDSEDAKNLKIFEDVANANKDTRVSGINVSGDGIKQSITEGDAGEQKRASRTRQGSRFAAIPGKQTPLAREIAYLASDNEEQKRQGKANMLQGRLNAEGRSLDSTLTTLASIAQAVAMAAGSQVSFPGTGTVPPVTPVTPGAAGGLTTSATTATVPNSLAKASSLAGGTSAQHGSNFANLFRNPDTPMGLWADKFASKPFNYSIF
jgi:hypothetical protein